MTPTLKQEIDRKCFEALEYLYHKVRRGEITIAEFSTSIDVLWTATAGLVNKDNVDLMTAANEYILENGHSKHPPVQSESVVQDWS